MVFYHQLDCKSSLFRQILSRSAFLFSTFLAFLLVANAAFAQAPEAAKPSDVRIVIDISGSMKKNDPQNLRRPALDMLVKLLPEGSKAGVWNFGQYVNMLVKHREVDQSWKNEADNAAPSINSIAQFTNIGDALDKAAYDRNYTTKSHYQTHVILLTDGMVDINRDPAVNERERLRILNELLPSYQQAGFRIHTVSLSDKADKQLMDRLALATDGKSVVAKTADELMNVFLQVFDQAVPKEELPFKGNSFVTDSSIEEFTALIFREPGSPETRIISPDNTEYNQSTNDPTVNWYRTDKYDLVTIKQPLEGEWKVLADLEPQSRITVVSDLSLAVKSMPTNILQNQTIDLSLALREENKVVTRAEFLDLLDIDAEVKHIDSQKQWTRRLSDGLVPGNGIYRAELDYLKELGQYEVSVTVDGKSFQRRFTHNLTVREPFAISTSTIEKNGKTQFKVTVTAQDQKINAERTEVIGKLKDPTGASTIKHFTFTPDRQWELVFAPKAEGIYYLSLRITRVDEQGKTTDVTPKPLSFKYPQADGLFETLDEPEPEPIIAPEPEPKPEPVETPPAEKEVTAEELAESLDSEELMDEEDGKESNMMQWILYGVLALVNILIILVIYLLYRKLFGKKSNDDEEDDDEPDAAAPQASTEQAPPAFEEPPMDEMVVDELDDEGDIDLADDSSEESEITLDAEDLLTKEPPEGEGLDEDPEFSLDDFAPDELDDDSEEENKE